MHTKRRTTKYARSKRGEKVAEVGAGLGVAAAAAGLAYLVGTRRGKGLQRSAAHITQGLKRDVRGRIRDVGSTTERVYHRLVDEAARAYGRMSDVDARELRTAVRKVKGEWRALSRNVGSAVKKTRRLVRHAVRKAKR